MTQPSDEGSCSFCKLRTLRLIQCGEDYVCWDCVESRPLSEFRNQRYMRGVRIYDWCTAWRS